MCFVGLWQGYILITGVSPLLLPSPGQVFGFVVSHPMVFIRNAGTTIAAILTGFCVGSAIGLGLGILMSRFRIFHSGLYPWLVASQMVPVAAIAPILVLWFGFTMVPKVIVVALICFFPVAVNTVDGLRSVDREMIRMMRTFGATPWKILKTISIPTALPSVFSGLRVAIALSVVAAVFGEWVGSNSGLGYLMLSYNNRMNTIGLFASVAVLSLVGIILFFIVGMVERLVLPWKRIHEVTKN
jgi:ABC-type nitrate/sulfonate/bicarbonate transport system permease component